MNPRYLIVDLDGPILRLLERVLLDRIAELNTGAASRYLGEERSLEEARAMFVKAIGTRLAACLAREEGPIREIHDFDSKSSACMRCGEGTPCCAPVHPWVIEYRSGTFFGEVGEEHGVAPHAARWFASEAAARSFVRQHEEISFNGGMPLLLRKALLRGTAP